MFTPPAPPSTRRSRDGAHTRPMGDLIAVIGTVVFVVVMLAFVKGLERL
ncbi:MAG: hypothetical protein M0Z62_14025 [Actinomycetota bacterium]|nr:hypothetical protein [Actinomycetota bacterium]